METTQEIDKKTAETKTHTLLAGKQQFESVPESLDEELREVCLACMQRKLEFFEHQGQEIMPLDAKIRQMDQKFQSVRQKLCKMCRKSYKAMHERRWALRRKCKTSGTTSGVLKNQMMNEEQGTPARAARKCEHIVLRTSSNRHADNLWIVLEQKNTVPTRCLQSRIGQHASLAGAAQCQGGGRKARSRRQPTEPALETCLHQYPNYHPYVHPNATFAGLLVVTGGGSSHQIHQQTRKGSILDEHTLGIDANRFTMQSPLSNERGRSRSPALVARGGTEGGTLLNRNVYNGE